MRSHDAGTLRDEQDESWAARCPGSSCTGRSPGYKQIRLHVDEQKLNSQKKETQSTCSCSVSKSSSSGAMISEACREGGLLTDDWKRESCSREHQCYPDLRSDDKGRQAKSMWFSQGQIRRRPLGTGKSWGCLWGCFLDWNSWNLFGSPERPGRTAAGPAH